MILWASVTMKPFEGVLAKLKYGMGLRTNETLYKHAHHSQ